MPVTTGHGREADHEQHGRGDQPVRLAALRADQRPERPEPDVGDHEQRRDDDDQQHPQPVAALHLVAEREHRGQDDARGAGAGQPDEVPLVGGRVDRGVEPGQADRRAGHPEEAGDPAQRVPLVAALREQGEGHQRRREAEGDQVGQRVELQAEGGDRADQPGDRAVGDVEDTDNPTRTAASSWSPRIDTRIAKNPQNMLARVKRLGSVASARRRVPRTEPRTNSTVTVRRVGGGIGVALLSRPRASGR